MDPQGYRDTVFPIEPYRKTSRPGCQANGQVFRILSSAFGLCSNSGSRIVVSWCRFRVWFGGMNGAACLVLHIAAVLRDF